MAFDKSKSSIQVLLVVVLGEGMLHLKFSARTEDMN